jgi:hypothetical protein
MNNFIEWMMSFVPTLAGLVIIILALFSSQPLYVEGMLRIMSITSSVTNFLKNGTMFMKYIAGIG